MHNSYERKENIQTTGKKKNIYRILYTEKNIYNVQRKKITNTYTFPKRDL